MKLVDFSRACSVRGGLVSTTGGDPQFIAPEIITGESHGKVTRKERVFRCSWRVRACVHTLWLIARESGELSSPLFLFMGKEAGTSKSERAVFFSRSDVFGGVVGIAARVSSVDPRTGVARATSLRRPVGRCCVASSSPRASPSIKNNRTVRWCLFLVACENVEGSSGRVFRDGEAHARSFPCNRRIPFPCAWSVFSATPPSTREPLALKDDLSCMHPSHPHTEPSEHERRRQIAPHGFRSLSKHKELLILGGAFRLYSLSTCGTSG